MCARRLTTQNTKQPALGNQLCLASMDTVMLQAWTRRVESLLDVKDLTPVASNVEIRTEFSGAGTAEQAFSAAAQMFNLNHSQYDQIRLDFQSFGDWSSSARMTASLNQPHTCQFGDIMGLVPQPLRDQLQSTISEKASKMQELFCLTLHKTQ